MEIKECLLKIARRHGEKTLSINQRLKGRDLLVRQSFHEETAVEEAQRCLGNTRCESCGVCQLFCPDLCITVSENSAHVVVDYNYCKGCSICAAVCPKGAIKMMLEES